MTGLPWGKFFWRDWLTDPNLSACSLAAQGLWMRMLCIMAHSNPIGHLMLPPRRANETEARQIARLVLAYGKGVEGLLQELEMRAVFSRDGDGFIISRRMIRDVELAVSGRESARKGWQKRKGQPNGQPIGPNPSSSPSRQTGHRSRPPSGESNDRAESESDSPPSRPRVRRSSGKGQEVRNGFSPVATDMIGDRSDAAAVDTRPGGARVVSLPRRA